MKVLVIEMCSYHCLPIEIHLQIARGSSTLATPGGALDNILSKIYQILSLKLFIWM